MEGESVEQGQPQTLQGAIRGLYALLMPDAAPEQLDETSRILAEAQTKYEIGTPMPDELREEVANQIRAVLRPSESAQNLSD